MLRLKTFGLSLFHCLFDFYSLQFSYGSRSCVCPRFGFCDLFQERFVCLLFGVLLSTMADDVGLADLFGDCTDDLGSGFGMILRVALSFLCVLVC